LITVLRCEQRRTGMLKGFREFLLRGNVLELAVAVVIGVAFQAVINAFVSAIIKPVIAAFPGASANGWGFSLRGGNLAKSTFIDISAVINAIIVFIITAAVVYFIFVLPMNKLNARRKRGLEPEPDSKPDDIVLLEEIRDLLRAQAGGSDPGVATTGTPTTGSGSTNVTGSQ
jgi:large conductance mechanosensitive channel